jgi:hypothetical protein
VFTSKSSNPFDFEVEDQEESINSIVEEMIKIDRMSFDTWYQSVAKFIAKFIPTIKFGRDMVYEVDDETGHVYMGIERRNTVRVHTVLANKINRTVAAVRVHMMPKTLLIEKIENEVA